MKREQIGPCLPPAFTTPAHIPVHPNRGQQPQPCGSPPGARFLSYEDQVSSGRVPDPTKGLEDPMDCPLPVRDLAGDARLAQKLRQDELLPLGSRMRLAVELCASDKIARLAHPSALCDNATGNYRTLTIMAAHLLWSQPNATSPNSMRSSTSSF
jgi:hypothetical protein